MSALTREHIDKLLLSSFLLVITVGCGQQSGCGDPTPYPENGLLVKQGMQAHVTPEGLSNLGGVVGGLIADSLGGMGTGISFCVPPTTASGFDVCSQSSDTCTDGSAGCQLDIGIESINVAPVDNGAGGPGADPADGITAEIALVIDDSVSLSGLGANCEIKISVDENQAIVATAEVLLPIDGGDERMGIAYNGTALDTDALNLDLDPVSGGNAWDFIVCEGSDLIAGIGFVRNLLLGQVTGFIDPAIEGALNSFLCLPCDNGCPAGSTCSADNVCIDDASSECVESPLGLEMALNLGDLLGGFGATDANPVALSIYPANYADASPTALSLGIETGATSAHNDCVPWADPPSAAPVPRSTDLELGTTPNGGEPYDMGIGISETFLEQTMWAFYIGGGLCLEIGDIAQLSTTTLGLLLPSINDLTLGTARPVFVKFAPKQAPTVSIGAGTIDQDANGDFVLVEPLLTLELHNLDIELYAYLFDRYVRIMTVNADADIPLGLTATPNGEIVPVLGDLASALSNVTVRDSELLSEDPATIAGTLGGLIGGFLPSLADGLGDPIALPELAGLQLEVKEASGIESNTMIGLFAGLSAATPGGLTLASETEASVREIELPMRGHLLENGAIDWTSYTGEVSDLRPIVHLDLAAHLPAALEAEAEFSYRVDGGLWSIFVPGDTLRVRDPALLFPGRHTIEVQSRAKGFARTLDTTPVALDVTIDWVPPRIDRVTLEGDGATALIRAADETSAPTELRYRNRVAGSNAWSTWSESPVVALPTGRSVLDLEVEVQDGQGNVAVWIETLRPTVLAASAPTVEAAAGSDVPALDTEDDGGCGCTTVRSEGNGDLPLGPAAALLFGLGAVFARRRRRASALAIGGLAALGLLLIGCDDKSGTSELIDNPCDECGANESCVDLMCVDTCSTCTADQTCEDADGDGAVECVAPSTGCNAPDGAACPDCSTGPGVCMADGQCGCPGEPCGGTCGADQTCCGEMCVAAAVTECPETCEPGFEGMVVSEGSFDDATCTATDVVCTCEELPEIPMGNFGPYTNIAATGDGNAVITAYNTNYGDLMFGVWDAATGETNWSAIDGIPADGEITGKVDGFRGGIRTSGPSVGFYTDVAVDAAGAVHVVYQDRDEEDLKYGRGIADGNGGWDWTFHTVDAEGRNGFWNAISISASGAPSIAYMAAEIDDGGAPASQVRFAQAASGTPASAGDWTIETVASAPLSACASACPMGDFCRLDNGQCETPVDAAACGGSCAANERCFGTGCIAVDEIAAGPEDWQRGIGLHTALARSPITDEVVIVAYDSISGNGWMSAQTGDTFGAPVVFAGADANGDTGNAGLWPSVTLDGEGGVHIAYVDWDLKDLVYYEAASDTRIIVDDGNRPAARAFVGDDASILLDGTTNAPTIVYQDSTALQLVLATGDGNGGFVQTVVDGEARGAEYTGAYGFYADHVVTTQSTAIMVTFVVNQQSSPRMRVEVRESSL